MKFDWVPTPPRIQDDVQDIFVNVVRNHRAFLRDGGMKMVRRRVR